MVVLMSEHRPQPNPKCMLTCPSVSLLNIRKQNLLRAGQRIADLSSGPEARKAYIESQLQIILHSDEARRQLGDPLKARREDILAIMDVIGRKFDDERKFDTIRQTQNETKLQEVDEQIDALAIGCNGVAKFVAERPDGERNIEGTICASPNAPAISESEAVFVHVQTVANVYRPS